MPDQPPHLGWASTRLCQMNDPQLDSFRSLETLSLAWQRVRAKNTAAGVDRQTVEEYQLNADKNLSTL